MPTNADIIPLKIYERTRVQARDKEAQQTLAQSTRLMFSL